MKTIIRIASIVIAVPLLLTQCENMDGPQFSEMDSGQISIEMDLKSMPVEVMQIKGLLFRPEFEEIHFDFELGEQIAAASVDGIPVGIWNVRVDAYDSYDDIIYSGSTKVEILVGKVTKVQLHLSKTGSVEIIVTWGDDTGLMAYYPFNGNAIDESGNGYHGKVRGATLTKDRFGNANSAYYFDGVGNEIFLEDPSNLDITGDITICAWFKTETSQWGSLVSNFDQHMPDNGYELCVGSLYREGGFIYFECDKDDMKDGLSTDLSFNDGQWHFVVATLAPDGTSRRRVFVDAIEQFGYNRAGGPISSIGLTPDYPFKIGAASNRTGPEGRANFKGVIDDVRIYNRVLDEVEIEALFEKGSALKTGTFIDTRDGQEYKWVRIGEQIWMAENLRATKYNDGTDIPLVTDKTAWTNLTSPAYCYYNNDGDLKDTYGALYNWYTVGTEKLAPTGWHVPTETEWNELEMTLGMKQSEIDDCFICGTNEGSKMAGNKELWIDGVLVHDANFGSSGFNALPAGYRAGSYGTFFNIGNSTHWWAATKWSGDNVIYRSLLWRYTEILHQNSSRQQGFSIRCVKD